MARINTIICLDNAKNTGFCDCIFDPQQFIGALHVPRKKVFTAEELAPENIQATLEALILTTKKDRVFPFQGYVTPTDNTEDPTFQTFGYGASAPVREGFYNWIMQFTNGGVQHSINRRTHNGVSKYVPIFIFQGQGKQYLIGTRKKDAAGDNGIAGVPQNGGYPYTYPWKLNDGTNATVLRTQYNFAPEFINEALAFVDVPIDTFLLSELQGLQNVTLEQVEVDDDTITVKAFTDCGSDLYTDEEFADELAQVTAWVLKNAEGEDVTITGVVKNEDAEGWDITANTPILNDFKLSMAAPSVLAASPINVNGYESDELEVDFGS